MNVRCDFWHESGGSRVIPSRSSYSSDLRPSDFFFHSPKIKKKKTAPLESTLYRIDSVQRISGTEGDSSLQQPRTNRVVDNRGLKEEP